MTKQILLKLKLVATEVSYLQLDAYNKDQKFKYVKASKVMSACRASMLAHNVIMTTTVAECEREKHTSARGGNLFMTQVKIVATFHDLDSDESISFDYYGTGMDVSDKAVGKAVTYAIKYALLKTFMIETGEDEVDDESLESIPALKTKEELHDLLKDAAKEGMNKLKEIWETILTAPEKKLMQSELVGFMDAAKEVKQ